VVLRMMLLLLLLLLLLRHGDGRRRYLGLFPVSVSVSLSRVHSTTDASPKTNKTTASATTSPSSASS
jgi:hypothetical protein